MPYYCTVPRCTSMAGKVKNVSFHQFPRDEELAKLWNEILKRGKPYTKYSKVCSLHFKTEDYTITSIGKNKGQWRTLRKDAVPSQNLPSDEPIPQPRKQSEPWLPNASPVLNIMDPMIHQQVAQAIYMQTMLAMQAVTASNSLNMDTEDDESQQQEPTNSNPQDTTHKQTNSYKCNHCTKFFKDPDVFLLHQRNHNQKSLDGYEKENFNINSTTVQSNPILVNLLKNNKRNIEKTVQNNQMSFLNDLGTKMDQYLHLAVLSKGDSLVDGPNDSVISASVLNHTDNITDNVIDTINNLGDSQHEINSLHITQESYNNDCVIAYDNINAGGDCESSSVISKHVDSHFSNDNFEVERKENIVNNLSDRFNERIQRLAILANTNYSLVNDDTERANLIFGNRKIIEGVIDFKLSDRVISNRVGDRVKLDNDDSDCDLNDSIESNNLIIDENA